METSKLQVYFFLILFLMVGVMVFMIFKPFIPILAVAAIFAVLFQPLYKRILNQFKGHEAIASIAVIILIAIFIITPLSLMSVQLFEESQNLYLSIVTGNTDYLSTVTSAIENPIQRILPNFTLDINNYIDYGFSWVVNNIGSFVSGTAKTLFSIVLVTIAFFFFLKDGSKFKKSIMKLSPLDQKYNEEISEKLETSIRSVVKGTLFVALIQGTLTGIGFLIFGIPNATLWGTITIITALIPGVGTSLVTVPGVIYLIITGQTMQAVGLLIWAALMVGTIDNFLAPYLYGRGIKIHPLVVLFSVLGGLVFFGPMGFIFGPIAVSLFFALLRIYTIMIMHLSNEEKV